MDIGQLTADVTDASLAFYIQRAESEIDSYMAFDMTMGGFEPHTCWMQANWYERTLKTRVLNFPVPIRNPTRYRIQVSNVSTSGAGFFADISPSDVVLNVFEGYVEIVPLQAVTYSLSPVILQLGLRPPIIQFDYTVGYYLARFAETLVDSGDHTTYYARSGFWATSYNVAPAIQPNQLPQVPPIIYVNGSSVSSSTYTVNTTEGYVTFNAPQSSSVVVTADYTYQIPDNVMFATASRVTWLLGQRNLNRLGMQGLQTARSSIQEMAVRSAEHETLNPEAAMLLDAYKQIPVY